MGAGQATGRHRGECGEPLYELGTEEVLDSPKGSLHRLTSTDHSALMLADATAHEKSIFVTKVFFVLACQAVTATLVALMIALVAGEEWVLERTWFVYLVALAALALVLGPSLLGGLAPKALRDVPPCGCVLLLVLTATLTGAAVGLSCVAYAQPAFVAASGSAAATFAGMTAYAHYTSSNFGGVFPYAFAGFSWLAEIGALLVFADEADIVPLLLGAAGALLLSMSVIRNVQLLVSYGRPVDIEFAVGQYTLVALTSCYLDIGRLLHEATSPGGKHPQAMLRRI